MGEHAPGWNVIVLPNGQTMTISNYDAANNSEWIVEHKISHIVRIGDPGVKLKHRLCGRLELEISDRDDTNLRPYFPLVNAWLDRHPNSLVHCYAGCSRSCSVVIAYLIYRFRLGYEQAFVHVKLQRELCDPHRWFRKQLRAYCREQ